VLDWSKSIQMYVAAWQSHVTVCVCVVEERIHVGSRTTPLRLMKRMLLNQKLG